MGVHGAGVLAPGSELVALGGSGLLCRGPLVAGPDATVFIGGNETFGRFVSHPFPVLLVETCGEVMNLGVAHAGLDCLTTVAGQGDVSGRRRRVLVQLPCAANLSNPYYRVHGRRNDRLLGPTLALRQLFAEVDYSEFAFVRALLTALRRTDLGRFLQVVDELQTTWVLKMRVLLGQLCGDVRLLWLEGAGPFGKEPAFVTEEMVQALRRPVHRIGIGRAGFDTTGMMFAPEQVAAARALPSPEQHRAIAKGLARSLAQK